ncbi:MAG: YicC family protein [Proteobacteria bacterium]|jgi:uncharacterized protein (TIGR00255 family)|nr:YicC family protein [Pseudomonadota bacterium]
MTHSMTAYAQARRMTNDGELSCEIRAVNHRYLEVQPRLPEELRALEQPIRDQVSDKLQRGRLDIFVRLSSGATNSRAGQLDDQVVKDIAQVASQVQRLLPKAEPLGVSDILRWPGVLVSKSIDMEAMGIEMQQLVDEALDELLEARAREGEKLAALIETRLSGVMAQVSLVGEALPDIENEYRKRLEDRLAEIQDLDPGRREQEVVLFLQKLDVAEELDRLEVHVAEIRSALAQPGAVGRRLDFLMQELNREANTLGSKSQDPRMTQASVELKVLIEQMREQIQNLE